MTIDIAIICLTLVVLALIAAGRSTVAPAAASVVGPFVGLAEGDSVVVYYLDGQAVHGTVAGAASEALSLRLAELVAGQSRVKVGVVTVPAAQVQLVQRLGDEPVRRVSKLADHPLARTTATAREAAEEAPES